MVDYNGLENRRAERHRGFESLSLRKKSNLMGCSFFLRMRTAFSQFFQSLRFESAPTGRARIPLSPQTRGISFLMPFLFVSSLGRADFADCHEIDNHFEDVKIRQLYTIDPIANDSPPLKGRGRGWGLCCPLSPFISLYLPLSPSISLYLPLSPFISLYLPLSPFIYFPLITDPTPFPSPAGAGNRREKQLSTRNFMEYNP